MELLGDLETNFPPRLASDSVDTLAQVSIAANDGTRGLIEFLTPSITVDESAGDQQVAVSRRYGAYGTVSVFVYSQTVSGALVGLDYSFNATELIFYPGESMKIVNISIIDDDIPEPAESFEIVIASPKGGAALGSSTVCWVTVTENDGAGGRVQFASTSAVILQEGEGADRVDIELTRGPGVFGTISVRYRVVDQSGSLSEDVKPASGIVSFSNQQSSSVISLTAADDIIPELSENFTVILSADYSFMLGDVQEKTIQILPNDSPYGLLSIKSAVNSSSLYTDESNKTILCDVYRTLGAIGVISVAVASVPQTATATPGSHPYLTQLQEFGISTNNYCSFGDYLLVLNSYGGSELTSQLGSNGASPDRPLSDQSVLMVWDGSYRPVAFIETNRPITCFAFRYNQQQYVWVINGAATGGDVAVSRLYQVTSVANVALLQQTEIHSPSDAVMYERDGDTHVSIISNHNSASMLVNLRFSRSEFHVTDESLPLSQPHSITHLRTVDGEKLLIIVAQESDVKIWEIVSAGWTLVQTIELINITDAATANSNGVDLLIVTSYRDVRVYQYNNLFFSFVTAVLLRDIVSVHPFYYGSTLMFCINTPAFSSLHVWNGTTITETLRWTEGGLQPLSGPISTSDRVIAVIGNSAAIYSLAVLTTADFMPRY